VVGYEKAKVHEELMTRIGKGMATNKNGLGVELELKNFKVQSGEIRVVVCAKKWFVPKWRSLTSYA
jgi:hypothetical protein